MGRHAVRRPEPDRRRRRARDPEGQDRSSTSPAARPIRTTSSARCCSTRRFGTLPALDARGPPEVRLRPHDPRALPAPRALRRRPLRARSSATRGTARATASTSSAARARRPTPTARCSTSARSIGAWPIGIGHPCFGCTEQKIAFRDAAAHDGGHRAADAARHLSADPRGRRATSARSRPASPARSSAASPAPGYVASKKLRDRRTAERGPPTSRRSSHGHHATRGAQDRRSLGGAAATAARRPRVDRRAVLPLPPADAVGLLYDTTLCIGCKACVVACQDANGLPRDPTRHRRALRRAGRPEPQRQERHQAVPRRRQAVVRQGAVHALHRSGVRRRLHARRAQEARVRHRQLRRRPTASAAATARSPARSTCRSSSGRRPRRSIVKCELCHHRLAEGQEPACTEVCPRQAVIFGKRADLLAGSEAAPRRRPRPLRAEGLRRDRRRRHAGALPRRTCRSTSSASRRSATSRRRTLARSVQHGVYGLRRAGGALRRARRRDAAATAQANGREAPTTEASMSTHAEPVGGPLITRPRALLAGALRRSARSLIVWRLVAGLGAATALNDGYPWGLWIAFDVVTGTALACGGYAVAHPRLHPQPGEVPPAGAAGDADQRARLHAGRRRRRPRRRPLVERLAACRCSSGTGTSTRCCSRSRSASWPTSSCSGSSSRRRSSSSARAGPTRRGGARWSRAALPILEQAVDVRIIALGLLLPTMHQSSLGTLMLLAGSRLHPLWQHAAAAAAVPGVLRLDGLRGGRVRVARSRAWRFRRQAGDRDARRPRRRDGADAVGRRRCCASATWSGAGSSARCFAGDGCARDGAARARRCSSAPVVMLASPARRHDLGHLVRAAMLHDLRRRRSTGSTPTWSPSCRARTGPYFPSVPEIAGHRRPGRVEVLAYIVIVKTFPILSGARPPRRERQAF